MGADCMGLGSDEFHVPFSPTGFPVTGHFVYGRTEMEEMKGCLQQRSFRYAGWMMKACRTSTDRLRALQLLAVAWEEADGEDKGIKA